MHIIIDYMMSSSLARQYKFFNILAQKQSINSNQFDIFSTHFNIVAKHNRHIYGILIDSKSNRLSLTTKVIENVDIVDLYESSASNQDKLTCNCDCGCVTKHSNVIATMLLKLSLHKLMLHTKSNITKSGLDVGDLVIDTRYSNTRVTNNHRSMIYFARMKQGTFYRQLFTKANSRYDTYYVLKYTNHALVNSIYAFRLTDSEHAVVDTLSTLESYLYAHADSGRASYDNMFGDFFLEENNYYLNIALNSDPTISVDDLTISNDTRFEKFTLEQLAELAVKK
jgi:hypothetical protein